MKRTESIMGMPITIEIEDDLPEEIMQEAFDYFLYVDAKFSTYKKDSEIMRLNRGELEDSLLSEDMKEILRLADKTRRETNGYFDIKKPDGTLDPSGLVKGWAIRNAAEILRQRGAINFYVEAGGDIEISGHKSKNSPWTVGIRNPFQPKEIVKVLNLERSGMATSGNYLRGDHIYNPHKPKEIIEDVVSISVVGPDVYEADRFATAAFAMGRDGINFIEEIPGLEGYQIDEKGLATFTSGFSKYIKDHA